MAAVAAAGVSDKVFEDYSCRAAYAWVLQYWQDHGTPPTTTVMDHEFPALKLPAKVDEPVDWLVEKLQERHVINRAQDVIVESANSLNADPESTVAELRDALDAILKDAGTSPGAALYTDIAAMLDNALPEATGTIPGELITDPDGNPLGVGPSRTVTTSFGGTFITAAQADQFGITPGELPGIHIIDSKEQ
ncbi:hypothetical protein A5642_20545 [Mycolicibacterium mucogenicum]|uniref:Uncharacterized protein n=2 Tax=Mycolicibacterium mucogenicum TaxID=56689 RepID=A0A1A0MNZ7_MYCMU|nr:hypothetical protein A5642_20545 [Mycolicibacterium mucogenicum]